jgi:hypothetical protein
VSSDICIMREMVRRGGVHPWATTTNRRYSYRLCVPYLFRRSPFAPAAKSADQVVHWQSLRRRRWLVWRGLGGCCGVSLRDGFRRSGRSAGWAARGDWWAWSRDRTSFALGASWPHYSRVRSQVLCDATVRPCILHSLLGRRDVGLHTASASSATASTTQRRDGRLVSDTG